MDVASGTLISYATKDGNVAVDGDGKNVCFVQTVFSERQIELIYNSSNIGKHLDCFFFDDVCP